MIKIRKFNVCILSVICCLAVIFILSLAFEGKAVETEQKLEKSGRTVSEVSSGQSKQESAESRRPAIKGSDPIEEMKKKEIRIFETSKNDIIICRLTIDCLQRNHYSPRQITPAMEEKWFQNYFDLLDSQHVLFLQSDIDEFRPYTTALWDETRRMANTDFAYKVFARYLIRLRERAIFEQTALDEKYDFSANEKVIIDRKEEPYPASVKEQRRLWGLYAKNKLLALKIDMEMDALKEAGKLQDDDFESEDEKKEVSKQRKKSEKDRIFDMKKRMARQFNYRAELEKADVLQFFLNALCKIYDPHTCYMTPEVKDEMDIHLALKLQGIGATLTTEEEYTTIVEVLEGSPAEKSGKLKKGDRIVAVAQDGQEPVDVIDMPLKKVVKQIRGLKGTKVTLSILPEGGRDTYDVTIVRDVIETPEDGAKSSKFEIKLGEGKTANVLVLYLPSFYTDFAERFAGNENYRSTTRDMLALIKKEKENIDGIIIDLRGNGGGGLDEAVDLSGLFFPSGNVVQKKNYDGRIEKLADSDPNTYFTGPLILMVDANSASAAEIMAAALQDMGRALIVGDRSTHGKGTVQIAHNYRTSRLPFLQKSAPDLGGIKITISKFYRINGGATQIKGVIPDIVFPSLLDNVKGRESDAENPLPWDEIAPSNYMEFRWLPSIKDELKTRSEKRVAASKDFNKYIEDISFCKKFDDVKELSLNIDERRKYENDSDRYSRIYRDYFKRGRNYYRPRKESKKPLPRDFVLEETLNIMADCINMSR